MNHLAKIVVLSSALILASCATTQQVTLDEITKQYPMIGMLQSQLNNTDNSMLSILSPNNLTKASNGLTKAIELAQSGNVSAKEIASQALASLSQAQKQATVAEDVFEDVLGARAKALTNGAAQNKPQALALAERELLKLTTLLEKGESVKAKAGRADVLKAFADIELASIKEGIVEQAEKMLNQAQNSRVADLSESTLKQAFSDYKLALSTLNANRNDVAKANEHASRAVYNVKRASEIAEVITHFKESDFSEEDKVLWFQNQLSKAAKPLGQTLSFDQPNKQVVASIGNSISGLLKQNAMLEGKSAELNAKLDELQQTKETMLAAKEKAIEDVLEKSNAEKQKEAEFQSKFLSAQSLFNDQEAVVYRQANNLLIRAHGFTFKSGNSEIDAVNFPLLNKIVKVIEQFPNSEVMVSGHTDSTGSDKINLQLSEKRAANAANFLVHVGRISEGRVGSEGFGEERPVATNDTQDGRAANRRVEFLIIN